MTATVTAPQKSLLSELLAGATLVYDAELRYSKNACWKTVKNEQLVRAVRSVTVGTAQRRQWITYNGCAWILSDAGRKQAEAIAGAAASPSQEWTTVPLSHSEILDALAAHWPTNAQPAHTPEDDEDDEA